MISSRLRFDVVLIEFMMSQVPNGMCMMNDEFTVIYSYRFRLAFGRGGGGGGGGYNSTFTFGNGSCMRWSAKCPRTSLSQGRCMKEIVCTVHVHA